ncbi:MAG: archease [Planctomycetes bacterium]|nr:archease [Planctomycetota bacterium]
MAKEVDVFEHTADVGLEARADSQAELYEALAEGLAGLIAPRETIAADRVFQRDVTAEDPEVLAVDFLSDLLALTHTENVVIADVSVRCDRPTSLHATVRAELTDPDRHELGLEIKAVTYHRLEVRQDEDGWHARVLFDV